ncbi:MAG TPA: hypothetical protein VN706_05115 [Gemmatimonadaceae bacterium]|nr:hypothetical protein [Gemmatimonadaceae bacterium]
MTDTMVRRGAGDVTAQARQFARDVCSRSASFTAMPADDQKSIYLSLVQEYIDKRQPASRSGSMSLSNGGGNGYARSMATDSGKDMGYKGYDPGFQGDTQAFDDLVKSVDFPKFVADLLKAVFDANLTVMKTQTDSYIKLMKECTKSTADFVKNVKDEDTFGALIEKHSNKYNLSNERQPDGSTKLNLTTPDGDKADLEDAEVKKDIVEAKLNMAKEHRAALREVLLMGVTRLVVDKGLVEAGVDFSIKANRQSAAHHEDQNVNVTNVSASYGGGLGSLFGGPSMSMDMTNTNIQVNTSDKKTTDDLSATLHGKVSIQFKTDYFKLDNFANMYADGGTQALKPPAAGGAPAPAAAPR